jgi:hypothetical protein
MATLAAVGDSDKTAPEVGGDQTLRQGGGVVDRFEVRNRSEGGSPELFTATLVADGETSVEARTRGRGGRPLGRGAVWRCTGARGWVGWGFGGAEAALHDGSKMAARQRSGGGGRRKEKGSFTGVGLPL